MALLRSPDMNVIVVFVIHMYVTGLVIYIYKVMYVHVHVPTCVQKCVVSICDDVLYLLA